MPIERQRPNPTAFNPTIPLPFELRLEDFSLAMQDVYDFFFDVNSFLVKKGLQPGRLVGSEKGLIDRGEKKALDEGAQKWCSRLDENRDSEAAEPG
jgi:hypothetical protein